MSGIAFIATILTGSGCITTQDDLVGLQVSQQENMLIVRDEIRKIEGRLEGIEIETDRIGRELEALRSSSAANKSANSELESRLAALQARIEAVDAARQKDKQEMINQLSARIAEIIKQQPRQAISGTGREHTIRQGETLSEIASAYGVSVKIITEANNIKNPDLLVVGQKLFIPQ